MLNPAVLKFSGLVVVVGRLKKWVKAVSVARKRVAFSTAFAHACAAIFNLSINMRFTPY